MESTLESFRCMMCGWQFAQPAEKGEDREWSCPKCRSNSIRHLKGRRPPPKE